MKRLLVLSSLLCLTGCTINLPFNNRLDYPHVAEAKRLAPKTQMPVSLVWVPASFPTRVDIQGAAGFVGGGSQTRIPTGVALTNRITEALDVSVGVDARAEDLLEIYVLKAESKFEYSAGLANVTPGMDYGWCRLEAEFNYDGTVWRNTFEAEEKDPTVGASSQTAVLEKAWDSIAVQVAKDVAKTVQTAPRDETYKRSEKYYSRRALQAKMEQEAEAEARRSKERTEAWKYRGATGKF